MYVCHPGGVGVDPGLGQAPHVLDGTEGGVHHANKSANMELTNMNNWKNIGQVKK